MSFQRFALERVWNLCAGMLKSASVWPRFLLGLELLLDAVEDRRGGGRVCSYLSGMLTERRIGLIQHPITNPGERLERKIRSLPATNDKRRLRTDPQGEMVDPEQR